MWSLTHTRADKDILRLRIVYAFPHSVSFNIPDKSLDPTHLLENRKPLINSVAHNSVVLLLRLQSNGQSGNGSQDSTETSAS